MDKILIYSVGTSNSCRCATSFLEQAGIPLTDHPAPEVTHLLLDIPGSVSEDLERLLCMLPLQVTVIGGRLDHPVLREYRTIDLLKNPDYLAANAAITAECALRAAAPHLKTTFAESPALILGWGRIGKCLAKLLRAMGCTVTVAARKESDRAMLKALGYGAVEFSQIGKTLQECKILFNTVPDLPMAAEIVDSWKTGIAFDLASLPGMAGKSVIPARGLPGKFAPETSGRLIADTLLKFYQEGSL